VRAFVSAFAFGGTKTPPARGAMGVPRATAFEGGASNVGDEGEGGEEEQFRTMEELLEGRTPAEATKALEELYARSGVRALEELYVFGDKPPPRTEAELQARIKEAVTEAIEACEDGNQFECATAWDEVHDLTHARDRKYGSPIDEEESIMGVTVPDVPPRPLPNDDRQGPLSAENPLKSVDPCDLTDCELPTGTFAATLRLESMLSSLKEEEEKQPSVDPARADLKARVEAALVEARKVCESGEDDAACSVAWDTVEELSAEYKRQFGSM